MVKERTFQRGSQGIARIHEKFGVQELLVKPCQQEGDVFITMRSGSRMIALSLTFDEFDDISELVEELRKDDS